MTIPSTNKGNARHRLFSYLPITLAITFLFIIFKGQTQEHDITPQTFSTPSTLRQAQMTSREDALTLLLNDKFGQQLLEIAQQISPQTINQESMFNKVALLSILNQHQALLATVAKFKNALNFYHYTLHSQTQLKLSQSKSASFNALLSNSFEQTITELDDEALYQINSALGWSVPNAQDYAYNLFKRYQAMDTLNPEQAINLIVNSQLYQVLANVIPITRALLQQENHKRYQIEPEVLITTPDGVELAATIVKKKGVKTKQPTALQFTIYADEKSHIQTAIHAAVHGYVGVVVNSRGKRSSTNNITPWEHEGEDATRAIDWLSKQAWSDGKVVMYGGSYNGFTQWAAAKHMHPALKAMAPYTAASLITGLPYDNNIVITGNYPWAFYVTNNNTLDNSVYNDWQKNNQLVQSLFTSGRAIQDIDKIDGKANPWFQKWLQHPSFDSYYQAMVPVKDEYAKINIPVLTITGYFDGGQISAIDYLTRHYKYNKNANHSLLIGPYNHHSAQNIPRSHHGNYQLDQVALEKDTEEIVFEWFDHLLYQKNKPKLIQDKVNYQLMGSNQWRHQPSLAAMNQQGETFYLSTSANKQSLFALLTAPETKLSYVAQTVDMTDRTTEHNGAPWPIIQPKLPKSNGLVFITEPFKQSQELAGAITGQFSIAVNKKDVDIGYNFYALDQDGTAFHLNNYRSRASYARDMSTRQLLTPNEKTLIPIVNARMTAKLLEPGSRLAIVLNVNKNRDAQVNMGSGKNVNQESISDAGEPLTIKWYNDSQIHIPIKPWHNN